MTNWNGLHAMGLVASAMVVASFGCESIDDDDTGDECEVRSCSDIDVSGFGDAVQWTTLQCNGQGMEGVHWPYQDDTTNGDFTFDSQAALDAFLGEEGGCPVDFDTYHVLGVLRSDGLSGGNFVQICGVYEQEGQLTVPLYNYSYNEDPGTLDYTINYHFVRIPITDKPVAFDAHLCVEWFDG